MLPWTYDDAFEARQLMGPDFWSYGLPSNVEVIETFLRYSHEQGLAPREYDPAELFAPEALEAFAI